MHQSPLLADHCSHLQNFHFNDVLASRGDGTGHRHPGSSSCSSSRSSSRSSSSRDSQAIGGLIDGVSYRLRRWAAGMAGRRESFSGGASPPSRHSVSPKSPWSRGPDFPPEPPDLEAGGGYLKGFQDCPRKLERLEDFLEDPGVSELGPSRRNSLPSRTEASSAELRRLDRSLQLGPKDTSFKKHDGNSTPLVYAAPAAQAVHEAATLAHVAATQPPSVVTEAPVDAASPVQMATAACDESPSGAETQANELEAREPGTAAEPSPRELAEAGIETEETPGSPVEEEDMAAAVEPLSASFAPEATTAQSQTAATEPVEDVQAEVPAAAPPMPGSQREEAAAQPPSPRVAEQTTRIEADGEPDNEPAPCSLVEEADIEALMKPPSANLAAEAATAQPQIPVIEQVESGATTADTAQLGGQVMAEPVEVGDQEEGTRQSLARPRPSWWEEADFHILKGLEAAALGARIWDVEFVKHCALSKMSVPPWSPGQSLSLYEELSLTDPSKSYLVFWMNVGEVSIVFASLVEDHEWLESLAAEPDPFGRRLKLLLNPVKASLPMPAKGPKDADFVGNFFGAKNASHARVRATNGADLTIIQIDLFSKWMVRVAMNNVGFRLGNIFEVLLLDWPSRRLASSCRLMINEAFLQSLHQQPS